LRAPPKAEIKWLLGSMTRREADSGYRRLVVKPCALAGTPHDQTVALGCVLALGAIFILEVMTPDDVVGALALLPLAAGAWMLSSRMAGVVMATGVLLFALEVLFETGNRQTLLLVALPVLVTSGFIRLCAVSLNPARIGEKRRGQAVASQAFRGVELGDGYAETSLTRREVEVARLAARAYTAAEIGQQLHIGERTVESHIASTYSKLGIRSRSELIRIASRLD
jgi:DNA-binding CsgD family transcriptional regulator